ncbi:unnamed protein product [Prorocentrum cordatum]|uniref:Protein-serine/threonine kinase n=1 Tax=Prorocentrum cordatum TaxID=2364126 RepID=A0ABN9XBL2_9DINO|nr:unnamed protein product [Polarella glacialis]
MSQYLALHGLEPLPIQKGASSRRGIVDLDCNVREVCEVAARDAQSICEDHTGWRPVVRIEAHSAVGKDRVLGGFEGPRAIQSFRQDQGMPKMAYIPAALRYIMVELLKNSCRATVEAARDSGPGIDFDVALRGRPISIVVCAAKGIPFEVGSHVWSYLYSTATKAGGQTQATELAGFGVGLPLSRLFARYLGGSLDLISLPGYGTHAYLWLPRLLSEQVEVVPDAEAPGPAYRNISGRRAAAGPAPMSSRGRWRRGAEGPERRASVDGRGSHGAGPRDAAAAAPGPAPGEAEISRLQALVREAEAEVELKDELLRACAPLGWPGREGVAALEEEAALIEEEEALEPGAVASTASSVSTGPSGAGPGTEASLRPRPAPLEVQLQEKAELVSRLRQRELWLENQLHRHREATSAPWGALLQEPLGPMPTHAHRAPASCLFFLEHLD